LFICEKEHQRHQIRCYGRHRTSVLQFHPLLSNPDQPTRHRNFETIYYLIVIEFQIGHVSGNFTSPFHFRTKENDKISNWVEIFHTIYQPMFSRHLMIEHPTAEGFFVNSHGVLLLVVMTGVSIMATIPECFCPHSNLHHPTLVSICQCVR